MSSNVLIYGSYLSKRSLQTVNDVVTLMSCRDELYTKLRFRPFMIADEQVAFVGPVITTMDRLNTRTLQMAVESFTIERKRSVLSALNVIPNELRSLLTDPGFYVLGPCIARLR